MNEKEVIQKYAYQCLHLAKFLIGHLTFYASFESKILLYKIHASINQRRLCPDSAGHFI